MKKSRMMNQTYSFTKNTNQITKKKNEKDQINLNNTNVKEMNLNEICKSNYQEQKSELTIQKLQSNYNILESVSVKNFIVGDVSYSSEKKNVSLNQRNSLEKDFTDQRTIQKPFNEKIGTNQFKNYYTKIQKEMIIKKLNEKNFIQMEFLDAGGEGEVFDGYLKSDSGNKTFCVFKIYSKLKNGFMEEINLMKSFEQPINIVKIIDFIEINEISINILIMEKCQYSLYKELQMFKKGFKVFSVDIFLQIVFDLIDGVIQFRIYKILHLDIKPKNILVKQDGTYVYTDFGCSSKRDIGIVHSKGCTPYYAPQELQQNLQTIDFKTDVYNLGKTLLKVIQVFKKCYNQNQFQQNIEEIINHFEEIVTKKMILEQIIEREVCENLHKLFYDKIITSQSFEFNKKYENKIRKILDLFPFDQNKDIPYFMKQNLYYSHLLLQLQKIQNKNWQEVASTLNDIGQIYQALDKKQNDLEYLLRSLQIKQELFQGDHPDIASSLNNVGQSYQALGDLQTSLKFKQESLEMRKNLFQEIHIDIASSLYSVGSCFQALGDFQNALIYQLQSLDMRRQLYRGNHQDIASSLNQIGYLYQAIGKFKQAIKYKLKSLDMIKQIFKGDHPEIAFYLHNVGVYYKEKGDLQNGLKYISESLEMRKKLFKENHSDITSSLNSMGLCYQTLDDKQKSQKYLLESLEMRKLVFSGIHPDIAFSLSHVGSLYQDFGDLQVGLQYQYESLDMRKQLYFRNHPHIASSLNNIGSIFQDLGEKKKLQNIKQSLFI